MLDEKVEPEIIKARRGGARQNTGGRREGSGRKSGTPNKISADLKGMILGALDAVDGQAYFEKVARDDPKTFCALVAKLLPTTLAGDPDAPLRTVTKIQFELVRPKIDKTDGTAT
jgi:hypothetical protein